MILVSTVNLKVYKKNILPKTTVYFPELILFLKIVNFVVFLPKTKNSSLEHPKIAQDKIIFFLQNIYPW